MPEYKKPGGEAGHDDWMTPISVIRNLEVEFGKLFDPCPAGWNVDHGWNGLYIDWPVNKYSFVNPPFSQIDKWAAKCQYEWERGAGVLLLIPVRTDTKYFHNHIYWNAHLRFFKGRLKFRRPNTPKASRAPFACMLCIFPKIGDYVSEYDVNQI